MSIKIRENVLLGDLTTFKIGGPARYFVILTSIRDLPEIINFAKQKDLRLFILGGGSNLLVSDRGFDGLVIKNEIKGRRYRTEGNLVYTSFGAGEIWDQAVNEVVSKNLWGLENLSGIPGTVGATPVQNIGAYGSEAKDTIVSVRAIHLPSLQEETFSNQDCRFGYRDSFFKTDSGKDYLITEVEFVLSKLPKPNLSYKDLKNWVVEKEVDNPTVQEIREMVLAIRAGKFPDLSRIGTAGSFFKNPIISGEHFNRLKQEFSGLPGFEQANGKFKVSLAWILDNVCKLKGFKLGKVALYEKQPLVMINIGGAEAKEIIVMMDLVKNKVKEKTRIAIEPEAEIL